MAETGNWPGRKIIKNKDKTKPNEPNPASHKAMPDKGTKPISISPQTCSGGLKKNQKIVQIMESNGASRDCWAKYCR